MASKNSPRKPVKTSPTNGRRVPRSTNADAAALVSAISTTHARSGNLLSMATPSLAELRDQIEAGLALLEPETTPSHDEQKPPHDEQKPSTTKKPLAGYSAVFAKTSKSSDVTETVPADPKTTPKRGRKWSDEDYRMRGHIPPAERVSKGRRHLHACVNGATFDTIRTAAMRLGVTLGEALDELLAS